MVTLRSDRKLAAVPAESTPSRGRKAAAARTPKPDRSVTPDRASQDSTRRRSRRVRDRQSMLGIIPEDVADTAASPEDVDTSSVRVSEASQLAEASTRISAEPDTAAQPLAEDLQASLEQADAERSPAELATPEPEHTVPEASEQPISSDADADAAEGEVHSEADTETSESEDNDDLLAQLSESMWASLRPEAQSRDALEPPSTSGRELKPADQADEEEMHWSPVTGLPQPLSAAACKGAGVRADRSAHLLEKQFMLPPRDTRPLLRQQRKLAPETAGKKWFDLPAPQMTDDMKRDLKLLQLRGTFDPKRFYKSSDHKKSLPKFFQVGTVVESAADFYSGRLTNNERKATITEELLADPELSQVRKRRFNKLQDEKSYWAKKRGRKTDLPRLKKNDRSKVKRMTR